ncbi:MAG: NTP transferase domain-containing protein [Actinomycetota bacterium]|nr:NTP transferase domain-containing protein [Actinomycetota bacterium]
MSRKSHPHPSAASRPRRLAAVVLTGGAGVRLGGVDKASLKIDGTTLLERAITTTVAAEEVVVVGEQLPTSRQVTWTREDPAGGGPAAGLLAGLDVLRTPPELVFVLAVDMPRVTPSTVARLIDALGDAIPGSGAIPGTGAGIDGPDAAVLVDEAGRLQTLAGVYRYSALISARPADRNQDHGLAVRELVAPLALVGVPAIGGEGRDIDTREDLRAARE